MTHVTCRLTAKNRDQLQNPTLGDGVWATFTFFMEESHCDAQTYGHLPGRRASPPLDRYQIIVCHEILGPRRAGRGVIKCSSFAALAADGVYSQTVLFTAAMSDDVSQQEVTSSSSSKPEVVGVQDGGVCRDYLRNVCRRGERCRFLHPVDPTPARRDVIMSQQSSRRCGLVFCHDYQNAAGCRRGPACRYQLPAPRFIILIITKSDF